MIEKTNAVRYQCTCDHKDCKHTWESDEIPDRCAKCKRGTWNRPLLRPGRNGRQIEAFGKSQTIVQWGKKYGISPATISSRIKIGWTVEDAIAMPVHKKLDEQETK